MMLIPHVTVRSRNLSMVIFCVALMFAGATSLQAQSDPSDWPKFMGPSGNGCVG